MRSGCLFLSLHASVTGSLPWNVFDSRHSGATDRGAGYTPKSETAPVNLTLVADEHLKVCTSLHGALQQRRRMAVARQGVPGLHEYLMLPVHRGMCSGHCSWEPTGSLVVIALRLQATVLKRGAALPQQRHDGRASLSGRRGRPAGRLQRSLVCTATRAPHSLPVQPSRALQMLVLSESSATDVGRIALTPLSSLLKMSFCPCWLTQACL